MTPTTGGERTGPATRICDAPAWLVALVARGGDGFVEIRYGRDGFPRRHFLPAASVVDDPEAVIDWTLRLTETYDVAIGMTVRGSKRGTTDDCMRANVLWADIDGGDVAPLVALPSAPALVCESSPGHLHAYWPLKEPCDLTVADEREAFVSSLRAVQRAVDSDNVCDVARIMRVPGTLNWKRCKTSDDDPSMVTPVVFSP